MELFHANRQWATRPDDERFPTLQALLDVTRNYAKLAVERPSIPISSLRVQAEDGDVMLVGKGNQPTGLTHWAFGQLSRMVGAPADYLRDLPATLAAQNINHGLANLKDGATANLLIQGRIKDKVGSFIVRALTSDRYVRVWNYEIAERLLDYGNFGWVPATPTFNTSASDKSTALYASDHDLFAFITHPDRLIREPGNDKGLLRGLIAINSEVGARKLVLMKFLYREMCGNHIIWGAEDVIEVGIRHIGSVRERFSMWQAEVSKYMDASAGEDEARIVTAKSKLIAATKEEVLDALFGKRLPTLSRKTLTSGYELVQPDVDGDPRSYWGMAQGLTRFSQTLPYADARTELDTAAGKLLQSAF